MAGVNYLAAISNVRLNEKEKRNFMMNKVERKKNKRKNLEEDPIE